MPRLTVKAIAEMLRLPAYNQTRILHEQKYPKQEPYVFRTPYYQPAIAAIRNFYAANNDKQVLIDARNDAQSIGLESRRTQIIRVLDAFEASSQAKRTLRPISNARRVASIESVEIKLAADLQAVEGKSKKVLYVNCRQVAVDPEVARLTVEIAHWVLEQNADIVPIETIEFIDLKVGKSLRFRARRPATIRLLKNNARIIEALWNTV